MCIRDRGCSLNDVFAFDTGPGNMVMDALAARLTEGKARFDDGGRLAAQGTVNAGLLAWMMPVSYTHLVVEGVVGIIQPQIKTKKQSFDVHIENITVENVYCDSVRLNQVLLNLLSNATK